MTICFAGVEYFTLTAFSDRQLQLQDLEVRSSCPTQPKDSRVCLKLPLQRPTSLSDSWTSSKQLQSTQHAHLPQWIHFRRTRGTTTNKYAPNTHLQHTADYVKGMFQRSAITDISINPSAHATACRSSWSPQFFKVKICWTALAISHN